MKSSGFKMSPTSNGWCPQQKRRGHRHRDDCHVKIRTEIGVMMPHTKECHEPPEAGTGEEGSSARDFRASVALLTILISDLWPPELGENRFVCFFNHQVCSNLLQQLLETNTKREQLCKAVRNNGESP